MLGQLRAPSASCPAAVDGQRCASDETGVASGEQEGSSGDLVRFGPAPDRDLAGEEAPYLGILSIPSGHAGAAGLPASPKVLVVGSGASFSSASGLPRWWSGLVLLRVPRARRRVVADVDADRSPRGVRGRLRPCVEGCSVAPLSHIPRRRWKLHPAGDAMSIAAEGRMGSRGSVHERRVLGSSRSPQLAALPGHREPGESLRTKVPAEAIGWPSLSVAWSLRSGRLWAVSRSAE